LMTTGLAGSVLLSGSFIDEKVGEVRLR